MMETQKGVSRGMERVQSSQACLDRNDRNPFREDDIVRLRRLLTNHSSSDSCSVCVIGVVRSEGIGLEVGTASLKAGEPK